MPSYRVELHSHCQGDPVDTYLTHTITEHIDQARKVGLDAIAVTWHRKACVDPAASAYARERGVLLITGMEAEINRRHILLLNIAENDLPPTPGWEDIRPLRLRKPEVFVIAPHPFYPHPSCLGRRMQGNEDCIDAVEWCFLNVSWLPDWMNPNVRAARWAATHGKTVVACSDAHSLSRIGSNACTVEAAELTPAAIFEAIRAGRVSFTSPFYRLGPLAEQVFRVVTKLPSHFRYVFESWWSRRGSRT